MNEVTKVENKARISSEHLSQDGHYGHIRVKMGRQIWGILEKKKRDIYDIGRLLSQAKNTFLYHGEFMPWIEKTFGVELPYSTAYNYMKIFEQFEFQPEMIQYYPVSFLMCFIQKDFPEELLQKFKEDPEKYRKVVDIGKFKKNYAAFKKGKISIYEILSDDWADTKESRDGAFELLRNENLKKKFDIVTAQIKAGFSKIDTGIGLVKSYKTITPTLALRNHYNAEFDKRIEKLQELKAAFNNDLDEFQKSKADAGKDFKEDDSIPGHLPDRMANL